MPHNLKNLEGVSLRLTPLLELKLDAGSQKAGAISGYASVFGGPPDSYGDIIEPGAFTRTLAEHKAEGSTPVMPWAHDQASPIGRWTEMREDERGLFVRGSLNLESSRGRDAHAHVKAGDVNGVSIGYRIAPGGAKRGDNGTTILTALDLVEVSVVAVPANRRARVTLASKGEPEDLLHKSGLPKAAAVRLAAGGWPALVGQQDEPTEDPRMAEIARALDANLIDLKSLKGFR